MVDPIGIVAVVIGALWFLFFLFKWPPLGLFVFFVILGLGLLSELGKIDSSVGSTLAASLALISAVSSLKRSSPARWKIAPALVALVIVFVAAFLISTYSLPQVQALQGIRLAITPLACAVVGLSLKRWEMIFLLKLATVVLSLSAVAVVVESIIGTSGLVNAGLEYGSSVRNFSGGALRAPGLFYTNYELGAFASVLTALAITWWPIVETGKSATIWRMLAIAAGILCLFGSIYRTGMIVVLVAVLIWILVSTTIGMLRKVLAAGVLVGGILAIQALGFDSSSSTIERFSIWDRVLSAYPATILGYGVGSSGAASGSRFAVERVITDNFFISVLIQYGIIGLVILIVFLAATVVLLFKSRSSPVLISTCTILGIFVGFYFVEFWEYSAAMSLGLTAMAYSFAVSLDRADRRRLPFEQVKPRDGVLLGSSST
jgi:hypothetical protein